MGENQVVERWGEPVGAVMAPNRSTDSGIDAFTEREVRHMQAPTTTVDAKGQSCPMPVLMAAKAARELGPGETMLIEATDIGAKSDIPAWVDQTGNDLLDSSEEAGVLRFLVRKK